MPEFLKAKVTNEIEFAYHDSGPPPNKTVYDTIILIHGHTYHSGVFAPMLEQTHNFGYRMILPNRRLYPGSTPYTKEETDAFAPTNSNEDITKAYLKQGEYLLLFVNAVIEKHGLERVVLVGWSLGTAFLSAAVASITSVSEGVQKNLRKIVKSIILWDPPATAHGIPNPPTGGWTPLYDESLAPEERGRAFGQWVVQYYPHKNIQNKDCHDLIYKIADTTGGGPSPTKTPTFAGLPFEQLLAKIDLTAGANGDNAIASPYFQPIADSVRRLSFFDCKIRAAWGLDIPFNVIYGEESPYNVLWAAWKLDEEALSAGLGLRVLGMPGANHFPMEDHTKLAFDTIQACI